MAFDYLNDLFGKFRHRKTKFTEVENKAEKAISDYVKHKADDSATLNTLREIQKEYYQLLGDTVDKDTPLWMNSFFGFKFKRWEKFQIVKDHFREHPEELKGEKKEKYSEICHLGIDEEFMEACKYCLQELKSK